MPTTKFEQQQSPHAVSNGTNGSVLSNELSNSTLEHKLTINGNGCNGSTEGHASDISDGPTLTNGQEVKILPQTENSNLPGRTKKFLVGAEYSNGHIPSDNSKSVQNGGRPPSVLKESSSPSRSSVSKAHSPDLRVRFSGDCIPPTPSGEDVPGLRNGATDCDSKLESEDLRLVIEDSKLVYDDSNLESKDSKLENGSPTEEQGATGVNPTLWLGDDQMVLLPGKGRSEETDSNSGTSETKSFEGLLSPNGTSILWDEDTDWILLFDNMIRYADRKHQRTTRSCGCRGKIFMLLIKSI